MKASYYIVWDEAADKGYVVTIFFGIMDIISDVNDVTHICPNEASVS